MVFNDQPCNCKQQRNLMRMMHESRIESHPGDDRLEELRRQTVFYNSMTRQKESFIPLHPPKVSFYSCGPTVYDFAHIGNFRAFLTYDLIKRWLLYCGYDVHHICNLTDIDDKIILRMQAEGKSMKDITEKYANAFFDDLKVLNIIPATRYPRATEFVPEIENMVESLLDKQFAYRKGGSVYFKVSASEDYGKLAHLTADKTQEMVDGAGGSGPNEKRGEADKLDARDFALWKAHTEQDQEVYWESRLGRGRPGWHIECSAMAYSLLGPSIDIHSGGVDLVFPHHTNEIAQSEAFTGQQPFSRYWIHNGFVNINNEKMSKSLKNFKTLRDIVKQGEDARIFRFLIVSAQYRNPLNFNEESLQAARNSLRRIDRAMTRLNHLITSLDPVPTTATTTSVSSSTEVEQVMREFEAAMADDLNTPRAMAAFFKIIKMAEKAEEGKKDLLLSLKQAMVSMDKVLGLFYEIPVTYFSQQTQDSSMLLLSAAALEDGQGGGCACCRSPINSDGNGNSVVVAVAVVTEEVKAMAEERARLKAEKRYAEADAIRQLIKEKGFDVKDSKDGYSLSPLSSSL
eukprot:scaffold1208_cov163-Ochromonas_danica.AAC.4